MEKLDERFEVLMTATMRRAVDMLADSQGLNSASALARQLITRELDQKLGSGWRLMVAQDHLEGDQEEE